MELVELLGAGEPVAEFIEVDNRTAEPVQIPFDPDWINRFLGTEISREDMVKTLEALEIHVDGDVCISPSFRIDLDVRQILPKKWQEFTAITISRLLLFAVWQKHS
mgnify:CR=1 FL=1